MSCNWRQPDRASGEILEDRFKSHTKSLYWFGDMELSAARRLNPGTANKIPLAIDLRDADDAARDWRVDVVATPPESRIGLPRRVDIRLPRWLVADNFSEQHFATGIGPVGGGAAGRTASRGAVAE